MIEQRHEKSPSEFENKQPNYGLRRTVAGALTGLALFGVYKGGEAFVDHMNELESNPIELGDENNSTYVVQEGDSPWSIARNYLGEDADVRPLVNGIREQIGEGDFLMPGNVIELPPVEELDQK